MMKGDQALFLNMFEDTRFRPATRLPSPASPRNQLFPTISPDPAQQAAGLRLADCLLGNTCQEVLDSLDIYEWRARTDYPVVACRWTAVWLEDTGIIRGRVHLNDLLRYSPPDSTLTVRVRVEVERVLPLTEFQPLSFSNFIYAIKECLVGFERLYCLFGGFSLNGQMVVVNQEGHVKVWLTPHYHLNTKSEPTFPENCQTAESSILVQLWQIFLPLAQQSRSCREFCKNLQRIPNFIGCIRYVQEFVAIRKILVSKRISQPNPRETRLRRPLSPVITLIPVGRTPKFMSPPRFSRKSPDLQRERLKGGFDRYPSQDCLNLPYKLEEFETKDTLPSSKKHQFEDSIAQVQKHEPFTKKHFFMNSNYPNPFKSQSMAFQAGKNMPSIITPLINEVIETSMEPTLQELLSCEQSIICSKPRSNKLTDYGRNVKESIEMHLPAH